MVKGAFRGFTHDHYFSRQGTKTLMHDVFAFSAPFGLLGRFAENIFLEKYMRALLTGRNVVIKQLAESGKYQEILHNFSRQT